MGLFSGKCLSKVRLDGKTAIVTGSNTGIGKETVKDFFIRGARVIMACRNVDAANEAIEDIKIQCNGHNNLGQLLATKLDLMSLTSVRLCAKNILETETRIDLLINNAGVMMCPEGRTEDGFEIQFATNHLGHFLFTLLLLPKLCANPSQIRIVNVSSIAHEYGYLDFNDLNFENRKYSALTAYQQSKLANVLFTRELARRLKEVDIKNINVYSLHPGVISTELGRHLNQTLLPGILWVWRNIGRLFMKTPIQGAQTTIYCSVDEKCANETGLYYKDCRVKTPAKQALIIEDGKRLWDVSLQMVGLDINYNPFK